MLKGIFNNQFKMLAITLSLVTYVYFNTMIVEGAETALTKVQKRNFKSLENNIEKK